MTAPRRARPSVDEAALAAFLNRHLGPGASFERTERGVSTPVYRIRQGGDTTYLRLGEHETFSMAPEAQVHRALTSAGVRVPAVLHYEPFDTGLRRSALLTSEVPGRPLADGIEGLDVASILSEAGRDLARINAVAVDGYGWVRRDEDRWPLRGEQADWAEFTAGWAEAAMERASGVLFDASQCRTIEAVARAREPSPAALAHGDFDASHIYVDSAGRYSGIIDFGEIRGAEPHYDLAHFLLHDTESVAEPLFDHLAAGWRAERDALPHQGLVIASAILIGARQLDRWLVRYGLEAASYPVVAAMAARVRALLSALP